MEPGCCTYVNAVQTLGWSVREHVTVNCIFFKSCHALDRHVSLYLTPFAHHSPCSSLILEVTRQLASSHALAMRVSPALFAAAAALGAFVAPEPTTAAVHVHDSVHRTLQELGRVSIVLTLKEPRPDDLLTPSSSNGTTSGENREAVSAPSSAPTTLKKPKSSKKSCTDHSDDQVAGESDTDGQHVQALVDRLVQYSHEKQQEVLAVIKEDAANTSTPNSGAAKSLWITNEVYVRDATPELIEKLKEIPSLGSIREEVIAKLSIRESTAVAMDENDFIGEWGLERIQALDAWKLGYLGRNIRVASIDSGVRVTHEALRNNFVGDYGWYDPISKSTTPNDPGDHGTAAMGLIAGGLGFGVAPKAQWMSCRACNENQQCRESNLLECAQFMTCPFLGGDKTKADCSKKPHIINNSWNAERGVDVFEKAINVWISAGIIPVFSNGNNGPGCGTVNSPADSTVAITVGATDYDDLLSGFSGRGPGLKGEIRPDLTAPGEYVVAPGVDSDSSISVYSGTSFAAPHAAGAIALLLEAAPGLTTSQVKELLTRTADTSSLSITNQPTCGALSAASPFPNNAFGYGRLNILKAINAQKAAAATASPATPSPVPATTNGSSSRDVNASSSSAATNGTSSPSNTSSSADAGSSYGPGTVNVGDE